MTQPKYSNTGLAQFVLKRYQEYKGQKDKVLVPKLQANLNAMERRDDERKKRFKKGEGKDWRSNVYLPITKAKVYAVFATLCDIELKGDTLPFALKQSPYEEELFDQDEELEAQFEQDRELMEDKIREQLRDFGSVKEHKKKILSKCIYGMAWSKFDVKEVTRSGYKRISLTPEWAGPAVNSYEHWETEANVPGHRYVSVWNMFWDMEDEDPQKMSGLIERSMISPYEARQKADGYLYIKEHIERVVSEFNSRTPAQDTTDLTPGLREIAHRKRGMVDLEFWGRAPRRLVEEFENTIGQISKKRKDGVSYDKQQFNLTMYQESDEDSGDDVEIMTEVIDEEVVRFARRDKEVRPYKLSVAELTLDGASPSGVADNMDAPQYTGNGLVRALLDNLRLSANIMFAIKRRYLADPAQADEPLTPGESIEIHESCEDVNKAMKQIVVQDVSGSILPVMGLTDKWGDDFSLVPKIMQGSVLPKQKPDTAYELSQSLENASRYLGALAKSDDDDFIKPEIREIYDYNMEDPEIQEGKGNYIVHATGFQTLQNKMVLSQIIERLLALTMSIPEAKTEIKVRPHLEAIYKNHDLDPDDFFKSEDEKRIEQKAMAEVQAEQAAATEEQARRAQEVETEGEVVKIGAQAQAKSKEDEENFQRDLVKEAVSAIAPNPKQTSKGGAKNGEEGRGK